MILPPVGTPPTPFTSTPEEGSISPAFNLGPKEINPQARELLSAQDPLAEFEKVEPNLEDAGGAKKIDLNARAKLGGYSDPLAEFQKADPIPGFEKADDLDVKSVDELNANREGFNPVSYFQSNPDAAKDPAKLQKLLDVYRKRREEGLKAGEVVKAAVKDTPGLVANIGGGIKRLGERAIDVTAQPVANVLGSLITGDFFNTKKREAFFDQAQKSILKGSAEVSAGSEAATVGLVDLSRQGLRKLDTAYTPTPLSAMGEVQTSPEAIPLKKPLTDQELLRDISDDVAFRQNAAEILTGQGEAAKNFGLDKETLAKQGIELDEKAIEQLSLVDPITMIATGGAFKLVGTAGKILGTASTLEGAKLIADKLANIAKIGVGKGIQYAGTATKFVGTSLKGAGNSAALITGVGAAVRGAGTIESLALASGAKLAGPAIRRIGGGVEHLGRAIAGVEGVPFSATGQKIIDYASPLAKAGTEVTKGALTGIAAAAPFAVMADEDSTAGALLGAGAALGAGHAAGAGAFRVVKQGASRRYFGENRPVLEDVPSPAYGKEPELDAQHEANIQKLSAQDASELNNFREALRQQDGEIYAVDQKTWNQRIKEANPAATPEQLDIYAGHSAFFDTALGDRKVVYLNADVSGTGGLKHDAGHIFDAILSPEKRAELRTAVEDAFTPEQRKQFRDTYERRVGNKITDKAAVDEFIAEQFAALFNNVPVTELNAPKNLLNKFIDTAAEAAETLGIDLSAGATTPNLGAPVSVGIRKLFQNAAGDVIRAKIEGVPATNVTPQIDFGGTRPLSPAVAPVAPASPIPINFGGKPSAPAPAPASRNVRVTPEETAGLKQTPKTPEARAAAAERASKTGIDMARAEAKKNEGSANSRIIERISDSMESDNPVVQIEHLGVTSESTAANPLGDVARSAEQSATYPRIDSEASRVGIPPEIISQHSKNFVPVRWFLSPKGKLKLNAMSLDKVITNIKIVSEAGAKNPKIAELIPYPTENGRLTGEGWRQVIEDAQAYSENQANGRKGDGGRLEVPEAGLSIPAENPSYTPKILSADKANFQNLLQGLETPLTSVKGSKGTGIPGNIKGQLLAEANRRPTETPARIEPKRANKQAFIEYPGRTVQEVNPLRNEFERRGFNHRDLLKVTEEINAKDIVSATPKPDINYKAPVTDIIRGGFQPRPEEFKRDIIGNYSVDGFSREILKASPEKWTELTKEMGSLTAGAWDFGLGLTEKADVAVLKSFQDNISDATRAAMKSGDFDNAYSLVSKGQFFREAYEAATGTGSAGAAFKKGLAGMENAKPPFPVAEKTQGTATTTGDTTTINVGEAGQFLPAEQLEVGTVEQPPELRVLRTPAAAGGTPPIEPPSGTVIPPPVAAGFQPAEQLQEEQNPELKIVPKTAEIPVALPPGRGVIPPPVAAKEDKESANFAPAPDKKIQDLAKEYAGNAGLPYAPKGGYAEVKPELAKKLAKFYEDAKSDPTNPEVAASYDALIKETEEQGKAILAAGYKIEPWAGAGEPYKSSAEAIADVRDNKHLFFRKTSESFGTGESNVGNPMLAESTLVPGQSANDVFRWVHDFFGHSKEGFQFGPRGEFNAWRSHSEMYSPAAQGALAGETLAQNSWVNYGPHLEGKNIPLAERPFAEQKNIVIPKELIDEATFQPRTEAGRKLEERGYEIVSSGEMGIRKVTIKDPDGAEIAQIQSVQRSPKKAEIAFVNKLKGAPAGLGEVLYREIGAQLKEDGVKLVEGNVISPEPLAIRKKVFGGFKSLDVNGEPATYEQALATAERIRNQTEREVAAIEPVNEITESTRFLPKRDKQGRPLKKNGEIDYVRWNAEGIAIRKKQRAEPIEASEATGPVTEDSGVATGWILPDKKFVPLDVAFHEQYLAENASALNKKFGTEFSEVASTDDRLDALNAGFVRFRNQGGRLTIEANADKWATLKSKVLSTLQDREGRFDSLTLSLLNDKGQQVDSTSAARLHEMSGPEKLNAIEEAVDSVRVGRFAPGPGLPGFEEVSVEQAGRLKAKRRIASVKKNNPEAVTPQYARDEAGEIIVTADGNPKPLTLDYDFINSPVAKEAAKGLKGAAREEAAAEAIGNKLVDFYKEAEKNPDLKAGSKWYSTARTRLRGVFGDDSKFFAELLGATSARTPVATNYRFALDAYNQFKAGAYDKTLAKYREGKAAWESGDVGKFPGGEEATRGQFLDWWVNEHDLGVTQSSGKKFGMNSRAVLRVLDGSWASEVQGPKTPNFAGNLTGESFRATIDVWSGRTLNRLANEGKKDRWRILPENEVGINDRDFYFGQAAYESAAKRLGIKADALQAVLWFAEKQKWEQNGWTRGAGAELSDFNVLLKETEKTPSGMKMKTPQAEFGLDIEANVSDIKKKR